MATTETWGDPDRCPFCGDVVASPGAGFIDHIEESGSRRKIVQSRLGSR